MDKIERHKEICNEMLNTYKDKNHDYGDSFGETFRKLGIVSAITRISDKTNRLQSICFSGKIKIFDESMRDTLLDLANYAIMTIMELEGIKNVGTSNNSD
ncbi:MAG: nucleotide modification associated domain-containing protein [Oscillospiraceae bacterium]